MEFFFVPIAMAARPKAWVCDRSFLGAAGSMGQRESSELVKRYKRIVRNYDR